MNIVVVMNVAVEEVRRFGELVSGTSSYAYYFLYIYYYNYYIIIIILLL